MGVGLAAGLCPAASSAAELTLKQQTDGAVVLGGDGPSVFKTQLMLPQTARQGPDQWWKIRLRYRLRLSRSTKPGFAWISSDTHGRTAASIEYQIRRARGRLRYKRVAVDVDGQREHHGVGFRDTYTFENYLQFAGVRGGRNTWSFRLEHTPGVRVERVEILGSSAVLSTRTSPYALNLEPTVVGEQPTIGRPFEVRVRTLGRRRDVISDASVQAQPPPGVRQVSADKSTVGMRYSFVASRSGRAVIGFTGSRQEARQAVELTVDVRPTPPPEPNGASLAVWGAVLAPGLVTGGLLLVRRRRRRANT